MNFEEFTDIVESSFGELDSTTKERFAGLDALYREWNARINVISRKDIDELYKHHVLHSLAIAHYLRIFLPETYGAMLRKEGNVRILDIGTGGGFPGIPLAVLFPGAKFTLCDSIGKKIRVAASVAESLGLENVDVINDRAENVKGEFDFIVSRAVTSLDNFLPWTKGKFSNGILYLKGGDLAEEIAVAMGRHRLKPGSVHTFRISDWLKDDYFDGKMVVFIEGPRFLRK